MINVMKMLLIRARVSLKNIAKVQKFQHDLKQQIDDIYIHEYREAKEIWTLIPQSQWDQYEALELTGLREQNLLKTALDNLKKSFNEKVIPYVNKSKTNSEDSK